MLLMLRDWHELPENGFSKRGAAKLRNATAGYPVPRNIYVLFASLGKAIPMNRQLVVRRLLSSRTRQKLTDHGSGSRCLTCRANRSRKPSTKGMWSLSPTDENGVPYRKICCQTSSSFPSTPP